LIRSFSLSLTNILSASSRRVIYLWLAAVFVALAIGSTENASAQFSSSDRDRGRSMLRSIKLQIREHYYDATFHGMDLDARFQVADEALKNAKSNSEVFGIIGQAVADMSDSHTYFIPPRRASKTEYGWQMQIIGSRCFIIAVKPKSDAEAKGLKVGDEVLSLNGYEPTRDNVWKMKYTYYTLKPQAAMSLEVRSPGGQPRELVILSKVAPRQRLLEAEDMMKLTWEADSEAELYRHRYYENAKSVFIWKMPQFDLSDLEVDNMMGKVAKHDALILDLRGNGGGLVTTLQRMVGNVFDRDITIGDVQRRKKTETMIAKTRGEKTFKGKLIVLVDSESGSASELFARVVQLEKRGIVLGDQTSGAVMQSRIHVKQYETETYFVFATSITDADIIMTDGKSLENVGVTPDEKLLMNGVALATQQDPVLAIAAARAGIKVDPKTAGTLFPFEWAK
jgi:carboxyl-terminal processing protease